jgi:excisionase family DNA binding protein
MIANNVEVTAGWHAPAQLHSKREAARLLGIGITKLRELMIEGKLKPVRIDRRVLIPDSEIRRFVADLVAADHG